MTFPINGCQDQFEQFGPIKLSEFRMSQKVKKKEEIWQRKHFLLLLIEDPTYNFRALKTSSGKRRPSADRRRRKTRRTRTSNRRRRRRRRPRPASIRFRRRRRFRARSWASQSPAAFIRYYKSFSVAPWHCCWEGLNPLFSLLPPGTVCRSIAPTALVLAASH